MTPKHILAPTIRTHHQPSEVTCAADIHIHNARNQDLGVKEWQIYLYIYIDIHPETSMLYPLVLCGEISFYLPYFGTFQLGKKTIQTPNLKIRISFTYCRHLRIRIIGNLHTWGEGREEKVLKKLIVVYIHKTDRELKRF